MKYGVYTIRDMIAELSGPLFISRNDQSAARSYREFMIKQQVPEKEYELFCLGIYDDEINFIDTIEPHGLEYPKKITVLMTPSQPQSPKKDDSDLENVNKSSKKGAK